MKHIYTTHIYALKKHIYVRTKYEAYNKYIFLQSKCMKLANLKDIDNHQQISVAVSSSAPGKTRPVEALRLGGGGEEGGCKQVRGEGEGGVKSDLVGEKGEGFRMDEARSGGTSGTDG